MMQKGKKTAKILLLLFLMATLLMSTIITASAADQPRYFMDSSGTLYNIELRFFSERENLVIPSNVKRIASDVLKNSSFKSSIRSLRIPNGVESIANGAFSDCDNLTSITIDNYQGGINIENGALPDSANVVYLREVPVTNPPATEPPTNAPTQSHSNVPSTNNSIKDTPKTTVSGNSSKPSKSSSTTKKPTTTAPSTTEAVTETVTETTTEEVTVLITENTPLASAKEQLGEKQIWEQLIGQSTEPASLPSRVNNNVEATASYAAVVIVAFSAVGLGYMKFRR